MCGLCGHRLLAVSRHAVQYLWQRVIIYCTDQHSSQCSNWKLYWSCKYSTLCSLPWGGMAVFLHVVSSHVVHLAHCHRGSGTLTEPKQAIPQKKKNWIQADWYREGCASFVHSALPGSHHRKVDRTLANAAEEPSATHLVYDIMKLNGSVWIRT